MDYEHLTARLHSIGITGSLTHRKCLTSSVTTRWGVDWNEDMIARDLMQNFYDANRDRIGDVAVDVNGSHCVVRAPAEYNLERLYYLGSEKGSDDVGQYGEGFKAATVCVLRNYRRAVVLAASGRQVLWIRLGEEAVEGTELYPLVYEFFEISEPVPGNVLLVQETSREFGRAMMSGLTHFFYDGNPLIGALVSSDGKFSLHTTSSEDGHIFYRRLKRGDIPGIPICLHVSKEYREIEKKIRSDRDRNAFGEEIRASFYKLCARFFFSGQFHAQMAVLQAAKPLWESGHGHPLLAEIARHQRPWYRGHSEQMAAMFGDRFFAYSHTLSQDPAMHLRIKQQESAWLDEGRVALPTYFWRFGVTSAEMYFSELDKKAREEARESGHREPTLAEMNGLRLLAEVVRSLAPELMSFFDNRSTAYSIAETEVLLGELKKTRSYRSREVFLSAAIFEADFALALSVFLHEHSHIFGHDGSRGFTDALTEIIECVVRFRSALDEPEQAWNAISETILQERQDGPLTGRTALPAADSLSESELRALVARIPAAYLARLMAGDSR